MRFLTLFWPDLKAMSTRPTGPDTEMLEYSRQSQEAGVLISQGMLGPLATEISLSDGLFSTNELTGEAFGYAYLEAASPAEAMQHVKEFLTVAGGGRTVIRQVSNGTESKSS